jgi:hypothetical protein
MKHGPYRGSTNIRIFKAVKTFFYFQNILWREKVLEGHKSTAFYCKTDRERPLRILMGE